MSGEQLTETVHGSSGKEESTEAGLVRDGSTESKGRATQNRWSCEMRRCVHGTNDGVNKNTFDAKQWRNRLQRNGKCCYCGSGRTVLDNHLSIMTSQD